MSKGMGKLYSPETLAAMLDMSPETLRNWRTKKIGPKYVKVGHNVRYRESDVMQWLSGLEEFETDESVNPKDHSAA